jgi:hypothetical protein
MVVGQNMPWTDQEARSRASVYAANLIRNLLDNLDDRLEGIRLELLRAGDRLATISKVDRNRRRAIELRFADSNARMVPDPLDLEPQVLQPYDLGSKGPNVSGLRGRLLAQFAWIGFRRTSSYDDEEIRQAQQCITVHHLATKCS